MVYEVNETGCNNLCEEMFRELSMLQAIIEQMENSDAILLAALGDDYNSIGSSINAMKGELKSAYGNLKVLASSVTDYMERVRTVRITLNNG